MGSILKFVALAFLILLILAFVLPLLWLVIQEICGLFGGFFGGVGGSNLIWIGLIVLSVIAIIIMANN